MYNDQNYLKELLLKFQLKLSEVEGKAFIGTWIFGIKNRTVDCSDEMLAIFGLHLLFGHPSFETIAKCFLPNDKIEWELMANRLSLGEKSFEGEFRIFDSSGNFKYIKMKADGIYENGTLVEIHGTCQDITELKAIIEQLEMTKSLIEEI